MQICLFQRNGEVSISACLSGNLDRIIGSGDLSKIFVVGIFKRNRKALLIERQALAHNVGHNIAVELEIEYVNVVDRADNRGFDLKFNGIADRYVGEIDVILSGVGDFLFNVGIIFFYLRGKIDRVKVIYPAVFGGVVRERKSRIGDLLYAGGKVSRAHIVDTLCQIGKRLAVAVGIDLVGSDDRCARKLGVLVERVQNLRSVCVAEVAIRNRRSDFAGANLNVVLDGIRIRRGFEVCDLVNRKLIKLFLRFRLVVVESKSKGGERQRGRMRSAVLTINDKKRAA